MTDGKINIAILIDVYSRFGGACKAALIYSNELKKYGYHSFFVCNNTLLGETIPDGVYELNSLHKCQEFLLQNEIDVVHYFKAEKGLLKESIFGKIIKSIRGTHKEIRTLITVCQQPSYGRAILTPFEIKNSDHILFIDKTAYNDSMFWFVPEDRKNWIYLTAPKDLKNSESDSFIKQDYEIKNNTIVFGRGSTLNKCPKDVLDVYERIKTKYTKKFVIVGVPKESNWLTKKISKRAGDDITTFPMLLFQDYMKIVNSFDILLYYLPKDSYSSRDGSLREAMRMGLPVVVYGPSVLKESVTNGVDGFYAETKDDFVKYAEMLANDINLRETLGRNARRLYFEDAPEVHWAKAYLQIIEKLCYAPKPTNIECPLWDSIKIYFKHIISFMVCVVRKSCVAILKKMK